MSEKMHFTCRKCGFKFASNLPFNYYPCPVCGGNAVADEASVNPEGDAAIWRARAEAAEAQAATLAREVSILRKAVEVAISDLSEAQGEWALVDPLYAPEWTHPYKEISDRLEHAEMQRFMKGGAE